MRLLHEIKTSQPINLWRAVPALHYDCSLLTAHRLLLNHHQHLIHDPAGQGDRGPAQAFGFGGLPERGNWGPPRNLPAGPGYPSRGPCRFPVAAGLVPPARHPPHRGLGDGVEGHRGIVHGPHLAFQHQVGPRSPGTTLTARVWAKALIRALAKMASSPTSVERLANSGTARVAGPGDRAAPPLRDGNRNPTG